MLGNCSNQLPRPFAVFQYVLDHHGYFFDALVLLFGSLAVGEVNNRPGLFVDRVREKWSVQSVERQTESRVTFADSGTKNGTTECQLFRAQHCHRCNVADVSTNLWKTSRKLYLFEKIRRRQYIVDFFRWKGKPKTKTKEIFTHSHSRMIGN